MSFQKKLWPNSISLWSANTEGQEELHCVSIDREKAYDRVSRQEVWNCLQLKEVEDKCIRLVHDMYEGGKTQVRCAAGDTEKFEVVGHFAIDPASVSSTLHLFPFCCACDTWGPEAKNCSVYALRPFLIKQYFKCLCHPCDCY
ncbi:uncharacterized protein LOC119573605 [Penaeus monodon]|uniref:uncharacterized protein LOC119573605 n=1 Tax=Penaeus monodon TaxID=6687 RepID=UPI0018A71C8A|nr:uncharacterized protein LOC119573605 [Penaeus monodon]